MDKGRCQTCKYYSPFKRFLLSVEAELEEIGDHVCGICKFRSKFIPMFILKRLSRYYHYCITFQDYTCDRFKGKKSYKYPYFVDMSLYKINKDIDV